MIFTGNVDYSSNNIKACENAIRYQQQQHTPAVLLLDTSNSMTGSSIEELNKGLVSFKVSAMKDTITRKRMDLSVITFGDNDAKVVHNFSNIEDFIPPTLTSRGNTPMGKGILLASELIEQQKERYRAKRISWSRPWLFLITDGTPTDMPQGDQLWQTVVQTIHNAENEKKFAFFPIGTENANHDILKQLAQSEFPPLTITNAHWNELFPIMSASVGQGQNLMKKSSSWKKGELPF